MLLSKKVSIHRIISTTWKQFLASVLTCLVAYLLVDYFDVFSSEIPTLIPFVLGTALAFFIANLAFPENLIFIDFAKIGILIGSIISGIMGALILKFSGREKTI